MTTNKNLITVGQVARSIIEHHGEQILKKLVNRVIRLTQEKSVISLGENSGLKNAWDEFCVLLHTKPQEFFAAGDNPERLVQEQVFGSCEHVLFELKRWDKISHSAIELYLNSNFLGLLPNDEMYYDNTVDLLFKEVVKVAITYKNKRIISFINRQ